jgi:DNA phosphorothioation-associated putative methyltransferase
MGSFVFTVNVFTVAECPFGKRLPEAIYLFRPAENQVPEGLWRTIRRAEIAAAAGSDWNIIKLHVDGCSITFLQYPGFDTEPHPSLARATKINLKTGSVVHTDYSKRANPPILHRKESFLPPDDPRVAEFAALTRAEEEAGLYREPSTIGLQIQWTTLLRRLGYAYQGHQLIRRNEGPGPIQPDAVSVARHRTAIKRYDFSRPVKQLLERGLLRKSDSFFDFGCGHGMDVEALKAVGYEANGWDPAFSPNAAKLPSDVVNLGFVLNVIEDANERVAVLREAFALTKRLLIVSTMAAGQEAEAHNTPYRDGFITKANTFQKFYAPGELEDLIEQTLNKEAITLGLGICVVFQDAGEAETFQAQRNRHRVDWTSISVQLKFASASQREQRRVDRYQLHAELFEEFWRTLIEFGRAPEPGEFDRLAEVASAAGSLKKAVALAVEHHGETAWLSARQARSEDVLVYLALTNFRKKFSRRDIPARIKHDVKAFFGDLPSAERRAKELLFAAGDPGEIDLACEKLGIGWQDDDSLTVHRSLLSQLPAVLRIFVHCAAYRYGDPTQADLIKIHKHSGKITFQHYADFDGAPLPRLQLRIKVNLRNLFVEVFDHTLGPKIQVLYFKERFVGPNYPNRVEMERFSAKLRKLGFNESTIGFGPSQQEFEALARAAGYSPRLNRLSKKTTAD